MSRFHEFNETGDDGERRSVSVKFTAAEEQQFDADEAKEETRIAEELQQIEFDATRKRQVFDELISRGFSDLAARTITGI